MKYVKHSPTGPGGPRGPGIGTPRESWKVLVKNGSFPRSRIETKYALVKQESFITVILFTRVCHLSFLGEHDPIPPSLLCHIFNVLCCLSC